MGRVLGCVISCVLLASAAARADDQSLWREYGLLHSTAGHIGKLSVTSYQMKDLTGALAVWEWLRSASSRPCDLAPFCTRDANRVVLWDDNYVVAFDGGIPAKAAVDSLLQTLPNKRDSALPAIFTFLPHQGLVPESARYVLGPDSLQAFAPELTPAQPGFNEGVEAQVAEYKIAGESTPLRLAIFYYPTPEMARLHASKFKLVPNTHVKRSGVLLAVVFGRATDAQADTLLSRVEYEAKITWNETPPPSPIKPLYQLLLNIMYLSIILSALCLVAGLIYASMRIYRRRYGTLDQDEAMTTLHLTGD
ncbi:MAG TPA: DUF6599 family protein [Bryobacteraceae bacterium]|jgi:hypothetical protein|nr:DUF6599 family protein [Bryobacteraceae bacterium]